jgi:hypothetical protein
MKASLLGRQLTAISICLVTAIGLSNCADQPKPNCVVSPLPFAVKLIEKQRFESTPGACDSFGLEGFNADPRVSVVPFYPQGENGNSDYLHGSVGAQTAEVGALFYRALDQGIENTALDGSVYSLGKFTDSRPDDAGFCHVQTLSPTHVVLATVAETPDDPATPDEDESVPVQPAADIALVWSNLDIYVVPANYGTQFQADLLDTRASAGGDTCAIDYRALGLAAATSCAVTDADGNPLTNTDGSWLLDATLCDPIPHPENGQLEGSQLTLDADYECDPVTAFCVIRGDSVPALK